FRLPTSDFEVFRLRERAEPGQGLAHHQGVDLVGAFVGVDGLQVGHVPEDRVFEGDAVAAQHAPGEAGYFEGVAGVVHLPEADLGGGEGAVVLAAAQVV